MDWVCPDLVDTVWSQLIALPALCEYRTFDCTSPLQWYLRITAVSTRLYEKRRVETFLRCLDRPFLRHVQDMGFIVLQTKLELLARSMLADMQSRAAASGLDLYVCGGYASWQLERSVDCWHGGDGVPRAVRGVCIGSRCAMTEFWIPHSIDVYVFGREEEAVFEDLIEEPFSVFYESAFGLWNALQCSLLVGTCSTDDEEDVPHQRSRKYREELERTHTLSCHTMDELERAFEKNTPSDRVVFRRTWTAMGPIVNAFFPLVVKVTRVVRGSTTPAHLTNGQVLRRAMGLRHCAVSLKVHPESYRYEYECDPEAVDALLARRLEYQSTLASPRHTANLTARYVQRGFTLRGDSYFETVAANRVRTLFCGQE